jgi:hypothetical protein
VTVILTDYGDSEIFSRYTARPTVDSDGHVSSLSLIPVSCLHYLHILKNKSWLLQFFNLFLHDTLAGIIGDKTNMYTDQLQPKQADTAKQ